MTTRIFIIGIFLFQGASYAQPLAQDESANLYLTTRPSVSSIMFRRRLPRPLPGNDPKQFSYYHGRFQRGDFFVRQLNDFSEIDSTNQTAALVCGKANNLLWRYDNGILSSYAIPNNGIAEENSVSVRNKVGQSILYEILNLGIIPLGTNILRENPGYLLGTDFRSLPLKVTVNKPSAQALHIEYSILQSTNLIDLDWTGGDAFPSKIKV